MLKPVFAIASMYIVLVLLDVAQGTNYKQFYSDFIIQWWQALVALYVLPIAIRLNRKYKYKVYDALRLNQFKAELKRFKRSSQMSSLITLYLLEPPRSHDAGYGFIANDRFYKEVVTAFHDKIANAHINTKSSPDNTHLFLLTNEPKLLLRQLIYLIAPFAWIYYVKTQLHLTFISDWPVLTLPVILALFLRAMYFVQASILYSPFELKKKLIANGMNEGTELHNVLPNTPLGNEIKTAHKVEAEYRQRCSYLSRNVQIPEQLPTWQHIYFPHEIYPANLTLNTSRLKQTSRNDGQNDSQKENNAQECVYAPVVTINLR